LKSKRWILWLIAGIAIVAIVVFVRHRIHFDWRVFFEQLRAADWKRIALAISLIYVAYVLRAARWALFVRPNKKVSTFAVLGSQVIGFTAVALFGRLADLVRPYLVARRINLSLGSQIAVYTVERMFDLGSMALIFSTVLLFAHDSAALPHHELMVRVARLGLLGTVALAAFAITVRISGNAVASIAQKLLRPISASLAHAVADKIRAFRSGLNTINSFPDFGIAVAISLSMWGLITYAYLLTTHAFTHSPELANLTLSRCMLLMAASMGGSAVQLPVIGWFTTIGVTTTAMQKLLNVAWEPALGCGAMLLVVTFMSIIPIGLIWAQFEHVSLKKITEESEHAGEEAELGVAATE
jgi:hypothetical protein